jgi:sugar-specific transcriptional regulator TrmB
MATKKKELPAIMPCYDHQRRTCIQVERSAGLVKFIPLDISLGLEVHSTSADSFDQRFTPMEGYPVEKACQLFANYSQTLGATKEAMEYLGQVINVSKQELEMATTKKQAVAEKPPTKPAAKKAAPVKTAKAEKPAAKAAKPAAKPAKAGEKKMSAAQMFQDLIMAGKLTDDQIFEKVQAEFGLDEKKRGYVKWYRNHLKKQGQNPPEAKVAK